MKRLFSTFLLSLCAASARADEATLRPSARLLFKHPELARPGACVAYREGGSGWIFTEPVFFLKGEVVSSEVRTKRLERCPEVPGKLVEQYSREEFNRLANAYPCVRQDDQVHDEQVGVIRFKVQEWETPWAKKMVNAGRLYQGQFIDRKLEKGQEMELEADLLEPCGN